MRTIKILAFVAAICMMVNSCKKTTPTSGSTNYSIKMTDAPGNFDAVYIDLQSVVVTGDDGADVTLNTTPRIYNLLNFTNGIDTLIATGNLHVSSVEQIRLILGPNNSVVVNGVSYPLSTPSAQESGLKIQVHQILQAGVAYNVLIDFDAGQSIHQLGNGNYQLHPVLRSIETAVTGAIKGSITPIGAGVLVTATINGTSYSTLTQANGQFLMSGLPAGAYSVTITPSLPINPVTIPSVIVTTGATADVGIVSI